MIKSRSAGRDADDTKKGNQRRSRSGPSGLSHETRAPMIKMQRDQLHLALRIVPLRLGPHSFTLDDSIAEIIHISFLWRRESKALRPTCVGRPFTRPNGPGCSPGWHLGVVAESALMMKESRRVMILTPDGDVHVEDASGQGREIDGIRWSENRALLPGIRRERADAFRRELGDVQLRHAEEAAEARATPRCPSSRGWSLVVARAASRTPVRSASSARSCSRRGRLACVGDGRRHPPWTSVWTKSHRFCDLAGAAGVGMTPRLFWRHSGGSPLGWAWRAPTLAPMILEFSVLPFCLSELTRHGARFGCGVKLSNY